MRKEIGLLFVLIILFVGCALPNKEYSDRMKIRAEKHFPIYKKLILEATDEQMNKVYGENHPTKEDLYLEIDGWKYLIDTVEDLSSKEEVISKKK